MLKRNLFFLFSLTIFALASFVLDLFNFNPFLSGTAVFVNFYLSLFFSLIGILAFTLYYLKYKTYKDKTINGFFWPSVRQSFFLSLSLVVLLILKGFSLLDWWVGISIVLVIILLELFFQTKKTIRSVK